MKPALPPESAPEMVQEPKEEPIQQPAREPGAGAQVRAGGVLGESSEAKKDRLMNLLADHQFGLAEQLLDDSSGDAANNLTLEQVQLVRGVLANRSNQPKESIRLLEPLVEKIAPDAHPPEEKLLRKTLAEDYLRAGDLAKAAQAYRSYETRLGNSLSAEEKEEIELPLKLLPLAAAHPAMTVEYGDAFSLPYNRDPLGLSDIPVFVDAKPEDWMLDPTAPFNLICRSTAKAVGLTVSEEAATVHSITGKPMVVHATTIPRLTLGNVTFRNMTAFVFEDADYYFGRTKYQATGVLGYPAVSALGSLTVTANARIEVETRDKGESLKNGVHFYLDGDLILVALGKPGEERMFVVDASGQQTYLTSRYYSEHTSDFADKKMQLLTMPGMQNKPPVPTYVAESVKLTVGATPVSFHYMQVLTQPLGSEAMDDNYGLLGMDALDELKSYTFDYRTMRFGVRTD